MLWTGFKTDSESETLVLTDHSSTDVAIQYMTEQRQPIYPLTTRHKHPTCTHLLPLVQGQVGLELEVGLELAGAELALVGAVNHHDLFGLSLALLDLVGLGLHLSLSVPVPCRLPPAALRIGPGLRHTLLQIHWSFCDQSSY